MTLFGTIIMTIVHICFAIIVINVAIVVREFAINFYNKHIKK